MHRLARCVVAGLLLAGAMTAFAPSASSAPSGTPAGAVRDVHADALSAALALATKAAALNAIGGFGAGGFAPLAQALPDLGLPPSGDGLARALEAADASAAARLRALQADGRPLGREVTQALTRLSNQDLRAATSGRAISAQPQIYLAALDELALRDGAPPTSPTPPDPQAINASLAAALAGGGSGGSKPSSPSNHLSLLATAIAVAVVAMAIVAGLVVWRRRRARTVRPMTTTSPDPQGLLATPAAMHSVLDASRRLTAGTAAEDIERAVVREMLGLVPGRAGALLVVGDGGVRVAHETQPGLLAPAGFTSGVVARALRSREPVIESVLTDGSFTRPGIEVALAPLISEGRVGALMVVVRDGEAFGPGERQMLSALAPVAAAAMDSAARTRAAVDASMRDPLTGVGNRRELDARLPAILAASSGRSTAFVMVDLDHFKSVNDSYGHPAGDALLRGVCTVISGALRPADAVYRYGGEEFCLLLPGTTRREAEQIAERVRSTIASTPFDIGEGRALTVTASLGVAATEDGDGTTLVARADAALYDAKKAGRDRVCLG